MTLMLLMTAMPVAHADSEVFPKGTLTIDKANGAVEIFDIEIARTAEQLHYGLMFRTSLPKQSGMLFLFEPAQVVQFWMKNTYLPLDLVLITPDNIISQIKANMKPEDESLFTSDAAVSQVLEINAGQAAALGINPGDKVRYTDKTP